MEYYGLPGVINTGSPIITVCNMPHAEPFDIGDIVFIYFKLNGKNYISSYPYFIDETANKYGITLAAQYGGDDDPEKCQGVPLNYPIFYGVKRGDKIYEVNANMINYHTGISGQFGGFYIVENVEITENEIEIFNVPYVDWERKQNPTCNKNWNSIVRKTIISKKIRTSIEKNKHAPDYELSIYKYYNFPYVYISSGMFGINIKHHDGFTFELIDGDGELYNFKYTSCLYKLTGDEKKDDTFTIKLTVTPNINASVETPPSIFLQGAIDYPELPNWQEDKEYFNNLNINYENSKLIITSNNYLEGYLQIKSFYRTEESTLEEVWNEKFDPDFDIIEKETQQRNGYIMFQFFRMGKYIGTKKFGSYIKPETEPESEKQLKQIELPELTYGNMKQQFFNTHVRGIRYENGKLRVKTKENYIYPFKFYYYKRNEQGRLVSQFLKDCTEGYIDDEFDIGDGLYMVLAKSIENSRFVGYIKADMIQQMKEKYPHIINNL